MLAYQLYELHSALILRHRHSEITRFISSSDTQSENLWTDSANRPFEFQKRSQLFIRTHDKTFSVAMMSVSNEDCSAVWARFSSEWNAG